MWRNVIPVQSPPGEVVHITDCYSPRTGGIETQVANLTSAQRQAGWSVRVLTATGGEPEFGVQRITAPIPFGLPVHPRTRDRIVRILSRDRPEIVHIHLGATSPFAWGAIRAVRELGIPTVVTVHSMWGDISQRGYQLFARKLTDSGVLWSAVSQEAASSVKAALGVPVSVLPNGIEVTEWQCANRPAANLRIVGVLRMAPRKRVIPWLKIVHQVQQATPSVSATLIGDGPLLAHAKKFAQRNRIEVNFRGRLDRMGMLDVFAESDAFLQASTRESFGIAALEARTAGLAIVARLGTGTGSFIAQGVNGYLESSDSNIVNRLRQLSLDLDELTRIKENNQTPPQFDWQYMVKVSGDLYNEAQRRVFDN